MALYGPGGFYENPPIGECGHFVTSPHVHEVFGSLLAQGHSKMWEAMGESGPPAIIEAGAGDGTLAAQLLTSIPDARYETVEASPGARRMLAGRDIAVVGDISELEPGRTAIVVANELLDNMPFHRVRMTEAGPVELLVGLDGDRFAQKEGACPPDVAEAAPDLAIGEEAAVCLEALRFVEQLARVLGKGYALLIDYERVPHEPRGGIHGYRDQSVVQDSLEDPGSADITAGVDFDAVAAKALREGLQAFGVVSQRQALIGLGFDRWMNERRGAQGRSLNQGAGSEAARTWSERNAAQLLVDPAGLGNLRWMVLSTPGLTRPDWY